EHENLNVIWQVAARCSTYSKLNKRGVLYKANLRWVLLHGLTCDSRFGCARGGHRNGNAAQSDVAHRFVSKDVF
ncbi:hypothetical protein ACW9IK_33360, partial [Pseudomonas gingeri]